MELDGLHRVLPALLLASGCMAHVSAGAVYDVTNTATGVAVDAHYGTWIGPQIDAGGSLTREGLDARLGGSVHYFGFLDDSSRAVGTPYYLRGGVGMALVKQLNDRPPWLTWDLRGEVGYVLFLGEGAIDVFTLSVPIRYRLPAEPQPGSLSVGLCIGVGTWYWPGEE